MPQYDNTWVRHKELTSIARHIRALPEEREERELLLEELRKAHDAMECDEFIAWCGDFRKRVEEERRKAKCESVE